MHEVIERLRGKLIVSCQALPDEPLYGSVYMSVMARAAEMGGAGGIRANGPADIAAIRAVVTLPILGINKRRGEGFDVYITPTLDDARVIVEAGSDLIALDGTPRTRPRGETLPDLIARIHDELGVPIMADISCLDDALFADRAGADIIATTLAGYTTHGRPSLPGPDLDFITELTQHTDKPIIAEGRFNEPEQVAAAFERGVFTVVVGTAITRPSEITRRFVSALPQT